MNSINISIPINIQAAMNLLSQNGYKAYITGGCLRDFLTGRQPVDFDISTSAKPEEIIETFKNYKQLYTGLKHGTVMVIIKNEMIEITTFRTDGEYKDNRRPESVIFTDSIETDLARRDFTINSMATDSNFLIDPFGGKEDIKNKLLRCVGNPFIRFTEDALRIMRALRFASVLEYKVEDETKKAMFELKDLLLNISRERITSEFLKALCGRAVRKTFMEFSGIIEVIIPEIKDTIGFNQHNPHHVYDVYEHTLVSVEAASNYCSINEAESALLKTVMFFHDIAKPACFTMDQNKKGHFYKHPGVSAEMTKVILERMRFPGKSIKTIVELIKFHDIELGTSRKEIKKILQKLGIKLTKNLFIIKRADIMAQNPVLMRKNLQKTDIAENIAEEIIKSGNCLSLKDLAVNGDDLIKAGIKKGEMVGKTLDTLLNKVINDEIENEKDVLIKEVEKHTLI